MRSILTAFLLFIASLPGFAADPFTARVVDVSDGDTITVESPGHIFKVRLFGPDGSQATGFTTLMAFNRIVQVIPYDTDRYGRMVACVSGGISGLGSASETWKKSWPSETFAWIT